MPIAIPESKPRWISFFDLETTDVNEGAIIEAGAIRVDAGTLEQVAQFRTFFSIPKYEDFSVNEFGQKHLDKYAYRCNVSPDWEYALDEFLYFLRGPGPMNRLPILAGYNISKVDVPILKRWLAYSPRSMRENHIWLEDVKLVDVLSLVLRKFHKTEDSSPRTLENVATALSVKVEQNFLHNPVYDSCLTLDVYKALKNLVETNQKMPKLSKRGKLDPKDPAVIAEMKQRYESNDWSPIVCPYCGSLDMRLFYSAKGADADSYFYACDTCKQKMNADGTKGFGARRTVKCDVEEQRRLYLDLLQGNQ